MPGYVKVRNSSGNIISMPIDNFPGATSLNFSLEAAQAHYYQIDNLIGKVSDGVTLNIAFQALTENPAPGAFSSVGFSSGDIAQVSAFRKSIVAGNIEEYISQQDYTVTNFTQPGHLLDSGLVYQKVYQIDDEINIQTKRI